MIFALLYNIYINIFFHLELTISSNITSSAGSSSVSALRVFITLLLYTFHSGFMLISSKTPGEVKTENEKSLKRPVKPPSTEFRTFCWI